MNTSAIRHTKGCNCKKSGCTKKYCECYQAGIKCTDQCNCVECKNRDPCSSKHGKNPGPHGSMDGLSLRQENLYGYRDFNGHGHYRPYRDIYDGVIGELPCGENADVLEENGKYSQPRKKLNVGNFNAFKSDLLDGEINPTDDEVNGETVEEDEKGKGKKEEKKIKVEDMVNLPDPGKRKKKGKAVPSEASNYDDEREEQEKVKTISQSRSGAGTRRKKN